MREKGWDIYRIWSTDWFYNRDSEVKKLFDYLDTKKHCNVGQRAVKALENEGNNFEEEDNEFLLLEKEILNFLKRKGYPLKSMKIINGVFSLGQNPTLIQNVLDSSPNIVRNEDNTYWISE
mgnify:CR=1 FL=1